MAEDRRKRRAPRKATAKYLRNSALYYLARYPASCAHLRRRLLVKVARSAQEHGTDPAVGAADVETLIGQLVDLGSLDDALFAKTKARALHLRGGSARAIRGALGEKGIAAELIDEAVEALKEEAGYPELRAALTYARKRRLGPYRLQEARDDKRDKDLAALGRRGFSYDLARRIVDAAKPEDLEAEIDRIGEE